MFALVKLSESDKRFIFTVLIAIVVLLFIIWYIGFIITRVMARQGKRIDNAISDVVRTRIITDKRKFKSYAKKKNWRMFYRRARWPIFIILIGVVTLIVRNSIKGWDYNPFNSEDGFASLLFYWDFDNPEHYKEFFGITLLAEWPTLVHEPIFVLEAWGAYVFVPCVFVGGLWYLLEVQALIARSMRIKKLAESIFSKNLDNFNQNNQLLSGAPAAPANNNQNQ